MKTAIDIKEYLASQGSLIDVFGNPIKVLIQTDKNGTYKECEICSMAYASFNDKETSKYLIIS